MKNKIVLAAIMFLLCAGASAVFGQQPNATQTTHKVDVSVYFRIGESRIDPDFEGNKYRFALFTSKLAKILADSNYVVSRLVVVGTSSPDGVQKRNLELAGARAQALGDYLARSTSLPAGKIEVLNGGENWTGLRLMMEASEKMPYRAQMLKLMDIKDTKVRKHKMMYYADSKPWLWMYNHFFDYLRIGSGGTQGRASLNKLSQHNWNTLQALIRDSDLDDESKRTLLDVVTQESDASGLLRRLKTMSPDSATYAVLQNKLVMGLLSEESMLSSDNWTLLREKIAAAADLPSRKEILHIIDNIPTTHGREQALQTLDGGKPYRYILDRFFPELLVSGRETRHEHYQSQSAPDSTTTLSAENWRCLYDMIAVSKMPDKESVLYLIDNEPDPVRREQKLRALNDGYAYRYINEVFFPELLYGISPAAKENWKQLSLAVGGSDMPHKDQILEIIRTTPPGLGREEAIRRLDDGASWRRMGELLLPELLQSTENVPLTGSGMSFYYELSPKAKAREAAMKERTPAANPVLSDKPKPTASAQPVQIQKSDHPLFALKTDLVLWGGVMPGFKIGTWTPNLSAEVYFACRWSIQAGYAYSNWNSLTGGKGLYALSAADLEVRGWLGKASAWKGFYLGVFGTYGQYDVQDGALGQTGSFWCAGLGAGYLLPLSRHWGLEAEIRGGYRSAKNKTYDIVPGHNYLNNKATEGKFVPQLRLQIVYHFGKSAK